jgi:hypothetical protein
MDTILKINSGESMSFYALGGNGGNGGDGGDGQNGGKGYRHALFLYNPYPFLNTLGEQGIRCN